ncbi:ComEC/Rec2 family competence protein [Erythrobacter sp. HKB08]|uniref:ComEC/Rec2 family competence protein n=1 Tax=Erythrobacter sp. HKB08 TaxID=2502843 RepID=UPI001008D9CD|nr:ComEC/Rec2 family competence protein [Erythrobacter sp. HKB08]
MATHSAPGVPMGDGPDNGNVAVQRPWRSRARLSSVGDAAERLLGANGFDRAPWLTVALACGIASWFLLDSPWQWCAAIGAALLVVVAANAVWKGREERSNLRLAASGLGICFAIGLSLVWVRSEIAGAEPIDRPRVETIEGRILEREEQPARERVRVILAYRDASYGIARKVRINIPLESDVPAASEGAVVRLRARLMPPAAPMLPGGYDFARTAWFDGLSATGSLIGEMEVIEQGQAGSRIAPLQRGLSSHVRERLDGSPAAIAAAFASGDRGAIAEADEEAMRDAGLTHLLSISGLHVSAVIAAAYLLALKLVGLFPWIALRVRLPLVAASVGALAGIGYTLLTGAEVPTVRSCIGALLVLAALALGREPLSMRMVAAAAFAVLLAWPEALVGPSFQMSFAAVLAIVALHNSGPVKAFLAPREESWASRLGRRAIMLLVTGLVIEIALMPIVLFHFHRAGVYGAFANVVAIPLVTFVAMPALAVALTLDLVGLGAPAWWIVDNSLELLLAIAHFTAEQPGSVKLMPEMPLYVFALFVAGSLWLALWQSRMRLLGFLPWLIGLAAFLVSPTPDVLVSGDGRHVGIVSGGERLLVLRESRSDYAKDNLLELAGMDGEPVPLAQWPDAQCSRDFCVLAIEREGRNWSLLMARSRERIEERALAAACERSDIVIADRYLPRSCRPRWLKADRNFLDRTGGLAIDLSNEEFRTVAEGQGQHGWWRGRTD